MHSFRCVLFFGEFSTVRIVLIELKRRVGDHGGLHVESAVAEEDDNISLILEDIQFWGGAAQNFSRRSGLFLRNNDLLEAFFSQAFFGQKEGVVELDGPQYVNSLVDEVGEVENDCLDEVLDIYLNFHKDVKNFPSRFSYRDQARVAIMDQQIAIHLFTRQVINAAGPVGYVSHNYRIYFHARELSQYVADDACEEHQPFWKLERDFESWLIQFFGENFYAVQGFIDFEVIMRGQDGDGISKQFVGGYVLWNPSKQGLLWLLFCDLFAFHNYSVFARRVTHCLCCLLHQLCRILISSNFFRLKELRNSHSSAIWAPLH